MGWHDPELEFNLDDIHESDIVNSSNCFEIKVCYDGMHIMITIPGDVFDDVKEPQLEFGKVLVNAMKRLAG
jgi:hypothetical protein